MPSLFVEHLTVIDCARLDAQRGLVGESWIVDVELRGALDAQGMVLDFGEVKRRLKRAIDGVADHRLVVPGRSERLEWSGTEGRAALRFRADGGDIEHQSPDVAVCLLDAEATDLDAVREAVHVAVRGVLPDHVTGLGVVLRDERIDGASYRYVHGLRKHDGACQRIAHGHRSRLSIHVDGSPDRRLERSWADRWADIYLGHSADVVAHRQGRIRFAYAATEGRYELELPAERCELLASQTTVEHIAEHIADGVFAELPGKKIDVRAWEGVHKGARATHDPATAAG